MRLRGRRPGVALLALALLFPAVALARDPTVGSCTLKDPFAKTQAEVDAAIGKLTAAKDAKAKAKQGKAVAAKYGRTGAIENLIRYRERDLRHVFLPLLAEKSWAVRARALYGLRMTGDAEVVPAVAKALTDADARVREAAANALLHLAEGVPPELTAALAAEKDPFVRASLQAAAKVLEGGGKPFRPWTETLVGPEGAKRVEWAWTVTGKTSFNDYFGKHVPDVPEAAEFDWPISGYDSDLFADGFPRKSYGASGTHVGEDMAWFREGCSYYAVADGVVRMIQGAGGDWGFLVLLEHRLPSGDHVCSLYGHAGFDVLVKPGEIVRRGQKIATLGLSCAVENGGYGAHLHFGISDGPFRRPSAEKGAEVEAEHGGVKVRAKVVRLVYRPEETDRYGFPGLGAEVALPDGTTATVPLPSGEPAEQTAWIKGYVPDCRGWFDPYKFIGERRPKD